MKKIVTFICALAGVSATAQTDCATARTAAIGATVFYKGVALNGPELGPIRYIQDGTAGLAAYGSGMAGVQRGDSVWITGPLIDFNGLLEASPATAVEKGVVTLPTPLSIVISQMGEPLESKLVRLTNVVFVSPGTFTNNTNYNFTDGINTGVLRISGGAANSLVGTAVPTFPVTITGLNGQFNTYQIVPRDLLDITPYVAPAREINVAQGATVFSTGNSFAVGGVGTDIFTISNTGSGVLTVSNVTFTGANAAEFTSNFTTSSTINGGANNALNVIFTPTGTGTRTATLTIANDDADENPFIINLIGYGTNSLATEPLAQPTGLTFPVVKAYAVNGQFTPSSSATNYLVVWKKTAGALTGMPMDGTSYLRGDIVGNGFVAYAGPNPTFVPRGIIANQVSQYAVYAFNGTTGFENYLTTAPLTGTVTSTGSAIGSYYGSINGNQPALIPNLTALINPHTVISYVAYKSTVMANFELLDTTQGRSLVVCAYTGERKITIDPFDWTLAGYSREHTHPHSWMPTFPADMPAKPEYSDQHNLYPTNLDLANSPRSNFALGEVVSGITQSYLDGKLGLNTTGQLVYEPRDSQKGNAARSIFYTQVAYHNIAGLNWSLPDGTPNPRQDQAVLKAWHYADLPDNYEIARNEYIFSTQNNRNPFVDSVGLVCHINFTDMTYIADCSAGADLAEIKVTENDLIVYPNPANEEVFIQVYNTKVEKLVITDASGKEVLNSNFASLPMVTLNVSSFESGMYIVKVQTPEGTFTKQMMIK